MLTLAISMEQSVMDVRAFQQVAGIELITATLSSWPPFEIEEPTRYPGLGQVGAVACPIRVLSLMIITGSDVPDAFHRARRRRLMV